MKKIMAMAICVMMFGMANMAGAYTQTQTYEQILPVNILLSDVIPGLDTATWTHTMPVNYDSNNTINGATLVINSFIADRSNDFSVQDQPLIGHLDGGIFQWSKNSFDLENIMALMSGNALVVSVTANEGFLFLRDSVFTLDYTNGNTPGNNTAPVPEPATLLLLGSSLSGLAFWGKRRKVE